MKPVVDRLEQEYAGKVEFTIHRDTADAEGESIAAMLGVRNVPTFVFVNSDGSVSRTDVGAIGEKAMRQGLDALR